MSDSRSSSGSETSPRAEASSLVAEKPQQPEEASFSQTPDSKKEEKTQDDEKFLPKVKKLAEDVIKLITSLAEYKNTISSDTKNYIEKEITKPFNKIYADFFKQPSFKNHKTPEDPKLTIDDFNNFINLTIELFKDFKPGKIEPSILQRMSLGSMLDPKEAIKKELFEVHMALMAAQNVKLKLKKPGLITIFPNRDGALIEYFKKVDNFQEKVNGLIEECVKNGGASEEDFQTLLDYHFESQMHGYQALNKNLEEVMLARALYKKTLLNSLIFMYSDALTNQVPLEQLEKILDTHTIIMVDNVPYAVKYQPLASGLASTIYEVFSFEKGMISDHPKFVLKKFSIGGDQDSIDNEFKASQVLYKAKGGVKKVFSSSLMLPFLKGHDLASVNKESGLLEIDCKHFPSSFKSRVGLAKQLASEFEALHDAGWAFADASLTNVRINESSKGQYSIYLFDGGCCQKVKGDGLEDAKNGHHTHFFTPPEMHGGQKDAKLGTATDIYPLSLIIALLLDPRDSFFESATANKRSALPPGDAKLTCAQMHAEELAPYEFSGMFKSADIPEAEQFKGEILEILNRMQSLDAKERPKIGEVCAALDSIIHKLSFSRTLSSPSSSSSSHFIRSPTPVSPPPRPMSPSTPASPPSIPDVNSPEFLSNILALSVTFQDFKSANNDKVEFITILKSLLEPLARENDETKKTQFRDIIVGWVLHNEDFLRKRSFLRPFSNTKNSLLEHFEFIIDNENIKKKQRCLCAPIY